MLKRWLLPLMLISFSALAYGQQGDDISEDDAYDPFADYSEFEASADEEADIHFFKNGRFFNIGFMFGGRMFTQELGKLNSPSAGYGMYLTYFFDLRTAIQVSYTHSEHKFTVKDGNGPAGAYDGFSGTTQLSSVAAHMKYYFNTANITRGFADLNPYVLGGFAVNYRNISLQGEDAIAKSDPTSVDFGGGIEMPIARKKMYVGAELMYHYLTFPDENEQIFNDTTPTGIFPRGDYMSLFFVLGINF